jgi:hypothetical protein
VELLNLIAEARGDQPIVENWIELVQISRELVKDSILSRALIINDSESDGPLYYIGSQNESIADRLNIIETYRASKIWFWLRVAPPLRKNIPIDLIKEEDSAIRLLRGTYFYLNPDLPAHAQKYTAPAVSHEELHPLMKDRISSFVKKDLDRNRVKLDVYKIEKMFEEVWDKIEPHNKSYASIRKNHVATLQTFTASLRPQINEM